MPTQRHAALILAGGLSSRMGTDKARLMLDGRTLLENAIAFWQNCCEVEKIYIACGPRDHFDTLPEGVRAVPDLLEQRGPMGGLHAAFHQTDAEVLWISGVDMPLLRPEAVLPAPTGDAIAYRRPNGRPEPLFAAYRRTVLPTVDRLLEEGCNKLRVLLDSVDTQYIPLPEEFEDVFRNVNTPEEFSALTGGN